MSERRLPNSAYNWTSVVGAMLAVASLSIILILFLIDLFVQSSNVYMGLIIYIFLPAFLVAGLLLIAIGMYFERRRRLRGDSSHFTGEIRLDLRLETHRNAAIVFTLGTGFFLILSTVGIYNAYHHTEIRRVLQHDLSRRDVKGGTITTGAIVLQALAQRECAGDRVFAQSDPYESSYSSSCPPIFSHFLLKKALISG